MKVGLSKSTHRKEEDNNANQDEVQFFSGLKLTNSKEDELFKTINNFKEKINRLSGVFQKPSNSNKKLEKFRVKSKSEIPVSSVDQVGVDFQRAIIKQLLTNKDKEKRSLIDALAAGNISNFAMPSPYVRSKEKQNKNKIPYNVDKQLINFSKKKEQKLQTQIFKLENDKLYV